jgi:hypothetical protein
MKNHKLMPLWLTLFFPKKFNAITISKKTAWYRDQKTLDRQDVRIHEETGIIH